MNVVFVNSSKITLMTLEKQCDVFPRGIDRSRRAKTNGALLWTYDSSCESFAWTFWRIATTTSCTLWRSVSVMWMTYCVGTWLCFWWDRVELHFLQTLYLFIQGFQKVPQETNFYTLGKSDSGADSATWWDLLPVGTQLFHGLQPWQWFPCWLGVRDYVHPCFPFYGTQYYQLLWDDTHWPQRGNLLVPQVRASYSGFAGWVDVSFISFSQTDK